MAALAGCRAHAAPERIPQPDFSGAWALSADSPDRDGPRTLLIRMSIERQDMYGRPIAPRFAGITVMRGNSPPESYRIGIIGGVVPGVGRGSSRKSRYAVEWRGASLVFESGEYTDDRPGAHAWIERRETWTLDSRRQLHVQVTMNSSETGRHRVDLVYRRH